MAGSDELFSVLRRFSHTLVTAYELSDVLHELTDNVVGVLAAAGAGVSVADPQTDDLRFATASDERFLDVEKVQEEEQDGPCFEAFRHQQVLRITDLAAAQRWPAYESAAAKAGLGAVLAVPMIYRGRSVGSINVYDEHVREWSDDDARRASVLADLATSYVASSTELDQMRRVNEQLQHALDSRVLIEQAKGVLAGEQGISVDEAFERLRRHARSNNVTLRAVCERVLTEGFRPSPAE